MLDVMSISSRSGVEASDEKFAMASDVGSGCFDLGISATGVPLFSLKTTGCRRIPLSRPVIHYAD